MYLNKENLTRKINILSKFLVFVDFEDSIIYDPMNVKLLGLA